MRTLGLPLGLIVDLTILTQMTKMRIYMVNTEYTTQLGNSGNGNEVK